MAQSISQSSESMQSPDRPQSTQLTQEACPEVSTGVAIEISQDELWTPEGRAPLSSDLSCSAIADTMGWPHKSYLQKTSTGQTLTLFAYSNVTLIMRGKTKHFFSLKNVSMAGLEKIIWKYFQTIITSGTYLRCT